MSVIQEKIRFYKAEVSGRKKIKFYKEIVLSWKENKAFCYANGKRNKIFYSLPVFPKHALYFGFPHCKFFVLLLKKIITTYIIYVAV